MLAAAGVALPGDAIPKFATLLMTTQSAALTVPEDGKGRAAAAVCGAFNSVLLLCCCGTRCWPSWLDSASEPVPDALLS